jgi:DNA-binding transcriptional MerR regulator
MQYRIERLAVAAGVLVDTVRFYQARGLLPAPRRVGRHAIYGERHLTSLRRIRQLQQQGLPLRVIGRLLSPQGGERAALRRALTRELGPRTLTRAELAAESGVAEDLIAAVESAGLVEPVQVGSRLRYGDVDVELARAALAILREGFPLQELLAIAIHHADHVHELSDRAIELFDRYVRRDRAGREPAPSEVTAAFKRLLPAVTALVAHHFQRTLVARALARLERRGDTTALRHARAATEGGRLEVAWR